MHRGLCVNVSIQVLVGYSKSSAVKSYILLSYHCPGVVRNDKTEFGLRIKNDVELPNDSSELQVIIEEIRLLPSWNDSH